MTNKLFKAGVVVVLSSLPLYAANETSGKLGLDACAEALASSLEMNQGKSVAYNFDQENKGFEHNLKHREIIYLDAKAPNTDKIIARANCIVNADAEVVKLVALPLNAPEAQVRARKVY